MVEGVLVQQAAIFSCTISCSIIVLWITSIAGDNRQAAERSGWYRTPASLWETIWIISCLPADCLWGLGDSDVWAEVCMSGVGSVRAMTQLEFPGRAGAAQSSSSVSHSSHKADYFILCFQTSEDVCMCACQWACQSQIRYQVGGWGSVYCNAVCRILCQWWNHGGRWYLV